jgi:hypothetical protein
MTGNCLGWVVYAYYTKDPFVLGSNVPGLILSFWLNSGAAKLQYFELTTALKASGESTTANEEIVTVPQESLLMRILIAWGIIVVWVGWLQTSYSPGLIVGICVNINLGKYSCLCKGASLRKLRSLYPISAHMM